MAAVAPNATGWWFKLQPAGLGVPVAPPTVPAGGLFVAADPTGPTAVAALRFEIDEGAAATLVLKAAQGSTTTGATIDACPATTPWSPPAGGNPGPIEEAPRADGCQPAAGQPSADGTSIGWSLPASFQRTPGTLDIVLLPSAGAAPFAVAFDKPDNSALSPGPAAAAAAPAAPDTVASAPEADTGALGAPAATPDGGLSSSGSSFATGTPLAASSGPLAPSPQAAPTPAGGTPLLAAPVRSTSADHGGRVLVLLALGAAGGLLWWLGGTPEPVR